MKNQAASVRARLLDKARSVGENFDLTLTRYGIERLLYRLVAAGHADQFILKGAQLLHVYSAERYRPTRDLDLLGFGSDNPDRLANLFRELCTVHVEPDGLDFDANTVEARTVREEAEYGGVRVRLTALLGSARIRLQVDVGFGDAITPEPEVITYPVILDSQEERAGQASRCPPCPDTLIKLSSNGRSGKNSKPLTPSFSSSCTPSLGGRYWD